jgi:hypothetical protein
MQRSSEAIGAIAAALAKAQVELANPEKSLVALYDRHFPASTQPRALGRKVNDEFAVPLAGPITARLTVAAMNARGGSSSA